MPHYALGRFTAAALRQHPRPTGTLASQLLLGEPVTVLARERGYCQVRCCDDDFEGYVREDQLLPCTENTFRYQRDNPAFALELYDNLLSDNYGLPVTFGARLPGFDGVRLNHDGRSMTYSGQAILSADLRPGADIVLRLARRWLYCPALEGGRTPTGVDTAAFVQLIFRLVGVRLPRTPLAMCHFGRSVDFVVQCQPADLAFFDDERGRVAHVGLLLPDSRVLHVGDRVRVDKVDHYGIFNVDTGSYSHRLRIVKRLLADAPVGTILEQRVDPARVDDSQLAIF